MLSHGQEDQGEQTPLLLSQTSERSKPTGGTGCGQRHQAALVMFLGTFTCYALRVNLSVALVAMVNSTDPDVQVSVLWMTEGNNYTYNDYNTSAINVTTTSLPSTVVPRPGLPREESCPSRPKAGKNTQTGEFNWSPNTQGIVLSAFFYGYITTQILGGWLAHKMGGKYIFGGGILVTAVLTLITPVIARTSVVLFIILRVVQGIGEGCTYPALYVMMAKWWPSMERSKSVAFVLAGGNIGIVAAQPISGVLCDYGFAGGWPSVFYVFGAFGCVWFVLWVFLVYESPEIHPRISEAEQKYILQCRCIIPEEQRSATPWRSILTSCPVGALAVIYFCRGWGHTTLLTVLPTYFKQVLKFDTSQNGFASGLPFLCLGLSEMASGYVADSIRERKLLNTTRTRKVSATLGCVLPAIALVPVMYMGCDGIAGVLLLCAATTCQGFGSAGHPVNHFDIAPHFAGPLMGLVNTLGNLPGIVTPEVAELISQGQPYPSRWRPVFFLSAGLYLVGAVTFVIFGTGEQQEWDLAFNSKDGIQRDSRGRLVGPEIIVCDDNNKTPSV